MGFFKSVRDLHKQAEEIGQKQDVGAQLEDAQARMAEANRMMAEQTAAANAATSGVDATATIAAVRQTGGMVNLQPLIELELTVMPEGLPPYPVTVKQAVPQVQLARAKPGASVHVKVDPDNPSAVWVDWERVS